MNNTNNKNNMEIKDTLLDTQPDANVVKTTLKRLKCQSAMDEGKRSCICSTAETTIDAADSTGNDSFVAADSTGDELDFIKCEVCGHDNGHDQLLLCNGCNGGCHTYCCNPTFHYVPEGNFFCIACKNINNDDDGDDDDDFKVVGSSSDDNDVEDDYKDEDKDKDNAAKTAKKTKTVKRKSKSMSMLTVTNNSSSSSDKDDAIDDHPVVIKSSRPVKKNYVICIREGYIKQRQYPGDGHCRKHYNADNNPDDPEAEDDACQAGESGFARMHRILRRYDANTMHGTPCNHCHVCLKSDCKKCKFCLNMEKYGGLGNWRRRCIKRQVTRD